MLGLTTRRLGWASLARRAHSTAAPKALDAETIAIIKATAPVLAEHGYAITSAMYGKMLSENPDVKSMFNLSHQVPHKGEKLAQQPHALACSVHAYAANIDNLGVLAEAVERIAQKHVSLQVFQEHYPVVGANLLWAIKHVLGDAATPEIMGAWERAYGTLADILVAREEEIRTSKAAQPGGWEGWRDFKVVDKVQESTEIASFYLKPVDGGDLMDYLPGSYTSIRIDTPELKSQRNYTLSKASSNDTWRITVKRESPVDGSAPVGVVSNWLHSEVDVGSVLKLGVPCGDFVLKLENDKPVVFLGAGVGVTPLVAMADYLLHQTKAANKIFMVTSSRCPEVEAMHDTFEAYGRKHLNFYLKSIYDEASNDLYTGQINADVLESVLPSKDNNYYVCGPPGFMNATLGILREWEVPENQIHHEYFGPPQ